ncbi:S10 family serine carboxypeptidase-like protein [Pseudidiomarina salinarum]|uniref:S10 family serine carboxypeptidase-like protein n=1 Tax=Pseudidiomarina salinarum TaxID=435908 RepID=UPI00068B846C|nr:hypothetical protein [Pseudidiomarina salinarum]RUO69170.1 peptidase S10 [Pseudidiomarina salinarum]
MLCAQTKESSLKSACGIALALLISTVTANAAGLPHSKEGEALTKSGPVKYTATIEQVRTFDTDGVHSADMVVTSYTTEAAHDKPVIFLFNGGPIVPSVYLHMGLLSPYRVAFPDSTELAADNSVAWQIEKNPYSVLDIADLVYVDPPETGYSRVAEGRATNEFYSVTADAQQVADFITNWLKQHHREQAPVFLFGESYGTMRATSAARQLVNNYQQTNLQGVLLFGQAVNMVEYSQRPNNVISYVASLPTLALTAAYHGKSAYGDLTEEQLFDKAWQFAQNQYLSALVKGRAISEHQLHQVAKELERFTGISHQFYIENRLKISKVQFRTALLPGKILGYYDARYVADYDPEQAVDASRALSEGFQKGHADYLKNKLGYASPEDYILSAPGITSLADWEWGGNSPFSHFNYAAHLDEVFAEVSDFHLFVGSGHYDLTTTSGAATYLVQQSSWPEQQVMLRNYVGGHMAYTVDKSARELTDDIRSFIKSATQGEE